MLCICSGYRECHLRGISPPFKSDTDTWPHGPPNRNTILPRQRIYQADHRPVYMRLPGSKLYYGIFLGFFWTGIAGITVGTYNMAVVR